MMMRKLTVTLAVALLTGNSLVAADDLEKLKTKLAREREATDRAKIAVKIGEIVLNQAAQAYLDQRYEGGAAHLGEYLGYVRRAYRDLEDSGRDARKKPKGFKELEIHLRQATLELEDLARALPYEEREPVEAARQEIEGIWKKLVRALFGLRPRAAGEAAEETNKEKKP